MIQHYFITATRNLIKYKVQTLVSIIGLAIGLVSFTYGYYWLNYETSYDGFHPDSKQIYLVSGLDKDNGKLQERMPLILARKLKQEFPEIKETSQIYSKFGSRFFYGETLIGYINEIFVDEQHFNLFPPQVICGRKDNLLNAKEDIVVTRSFAKKYWKTPEEAIGQALRNGYKKNFNIVAVVEDPPRNSLLQTEVYELDEFDRRMEREAPEENQWKLATSKIYLLLDKQTDAKTFGKKIEHYMTERNHSESLSLKLVPLTDIRHTFGTELSFNINYIRTFAITTWLLLLCVFFNFGNLLLNRIYQRGKEMRLRNSLGAGKSSLIGQLLCELSLLLVAGAFLGYCILEVSAPAFGKLFETETPRSILSLNYLLISLISWFLLTAILLPVLLHFIRSSSLLLSGGVSADRKPFLRKVSMAAQLCIGVFFLMSTLIIGRQISFMKNKDLGFNKEELVTVTMNVSKREEITHEMAALSSVRQMSAGGIFSIQHEPRLDKEVKWTDKNSDNNPGFQFINVGEEFIDVLQIELKEGRFLTPDDKNGVVINEEAARVMGMQHPVGGTVTVNENFYRQDGVQPTKDLTIVGVVKDFQSASLRNPIYPQIIQYDHSKWFSYMYYMRVAPGTEEATIQEIRKIFKKHHTPGDRECDAATMNQVFEKLNSSENASMQLFTLLAILCTLISLFGIYSISSGNMEQRRKEVAIRKVMGASTGMIIRMFFSEYLLISVLANLISLPLAWLFMQSWLEQYPYRATIGIGLYTGVFVITTLLVLLSVFWQTFRAAEANPAEVVKSE